MGVISGAILGIALGALAVALPVAAFGHDIRLWFPAVAAYLVGAGVVGSNVIDLPDETRTESFIAACVLAIIWPIAVLVKWASSSDG